MERKYAEWYIPICQYFRAFPQVLMYFAPLDRYMCTDTRRHVAARANSSSVGRRNNSIITTPPVATDPDTNHHAR